MNISEASNKCPKPIVDGENGLYKLKEINTVNQTFDVHQVLRKCKVVQDWFSCKDKFATNYGGGEIIHKLELKEPQAIQCSEGLRATNPNKCDSSGTLGIEVSIRTSGPELMVVMHKL